MSKPADCSLSKTPSESGSIVIDALAARYGGTAHVAVQLAHHLAGYPDLGSIVVVTREGSLVARGVRPDSSLRVVTLPGQKRLELVRRLLWEGLALPAFVRRHRVSSVLTMSGMLPCGVGAPVVTYLLNPVMFERGGAANRLRRWSARQTARLAARVLVPSQAMAALVEQGIGIKAQVVPFGIDHTRFTPVGELGTDVLCVADFYRHKRHDVLLEAWATLPHPRPRLRIIGDGRVDPSWHAKIAARATEYRKMGDISLSSGLSLDELVAAYRSARVFALASEHESFCLPVLEAQACGVPAVLRDTPTLRETAGQGQTYVAGDDARTWAGAIERLIVDDNAHATARAKGLEHARGYTWERTAAAVRAQLPEAKN